MDQFLSMPWPIQLGIVIIVCILMLGVFRFVFSLLTLISMMFLLWLGWIATWVVLYISSLFKGRK